MIYLYDYIKKLIYVDKQKLKLAYENSFLESVFEKLVYKSKSIKNKSLFTDQVLHLFTNKIDEQKQMIFKSNNDLLVITQNGNTFKGKWSYLRISWNYY